MVEIPEEDLRFDWPSQAGKFLAMEIVKVLKREFLETNFEQKKRTVSASGKFETAQ